MQWYFGVMLAFILISNPAKAFPAIFSNQDYGTTEEQCKDIAAFTRKKILSALSQVNHEDIDYSFKLEWFKRKIPAQNGAYIDSKYDKDLYLGMAHYADTTVRGLSVIARKDDNTIDLSKTPSLEKIQSECLRRDIEVGQNLNSSWADEIEEARATKNQPVSPRYVLGEKDYNNINYTCERIAKETHQRVLLTIKSRANLYDAKQAYFGQSNLISGLEDASRNNPAMDLYLPNGQMYKSRLKEWNHKYSNAIFDAVGAKRTPITVQEGADQCKQLSYNFWMKAL